MPTITASEARRNLFPLLDQVNRDADVIRISSKAGNGVLMSERDYEAWMTTLHLFSTPANSRRLLESIQQATTGQTIDKDPSILEEDDDDA